MPRARMRRLPKGALGNNLDSRDKLKKLELKAPAGYGSRSGWRIRKLQLFGTCQECRKLCKRGERCWVHPSIELDRADRYMHLECGPPRGYEDEDE